MHILHIPMISLEHFVPNVPYFHAKHLKLLNLNKNLLLIYHLIDNNKTIVLYICK